MIRIEHPTAVRALISHGHSYCGRQFAVTFAKSRTRGRATATEAKASASLGEQKTPPIISSVVSSQIIRRMAPSGTRPEVLADSAASTRSTRGANRRSRTRGCGPGADSTHTGARRDRFVSHSCPARWASRQYGRPCSSRPIDRSNRPVLTPLRIAPSETSSCRASDLGEHRPFYVPALRTAHAKCGP